MGAEPTKFQLHLVSKLK